jgi:hypothetical protein
VAAVFLLLVASIALLSLREWILLMLQRKPAVLREATPVWLPDYALARTTPANLIGPLALGIALAKELSGEAELAREHSAALVCHCNDLAGPSALLARSQKTQVSTYLKVTEARFNGIRRCC